ncbi:MAG TPA: hypothetical protein VNL77_23870 [Roseiflexaceae bacterium]|nr:hypothetical protein [Roseiflexaceae bacterium]
MRAAAAWKLAAAVAVVGAALAMSAYLGAAAIQRRMLGPPEIELALGSARLAAFTTHTPNCRVPSRRPGQNSLCSSHSINPADEYFAVWVMLRSKRGAVTFERADRLFVMRLAERP